MFGLKEEHIIKAGGEYRIDQFKTQWIDLQKGEGRSKLVFYNSNGTFNVYVMSNTPNRTTTGTYIDMCQFTVIKTWIAFKILCYIFNK